MICLGTNLGISKTYAASFADNLDLAKKAVGNIAPAISDSARDTQADSLVSTPEGFLNKPLVTETKITPEEKPAVRRTASRQVSANNASRQEAKSVKVFAASNDGGNHFPYGYCTYYAASRRYVPWFGNAITWLSGARSYGFATGDTPAVGAIVVTTEGGSAGHVAVVDAINGNQITISEMNYRGFGVISSRTISASYGAIKGYIY